jgi:hypothetical protein
MRMLLGSSDRRSRGARCGVRRARESVVGKNDQARQPVGQVRPHSGRLGTHAASLRRRSPAQRHGNRVDGQATAIAAECFRFRRHPSRHHTAEAGSKQRESGWQGRGSNRGKFGEPLAGATRRRGAVEKKMLTKKFWPLVMSNDGFWAKKSIVFGPTRNAFHISVGLIVQKVIRPPVDPPQAAPFPMAIEAGSIAALR